MTTEAPKSNETVETNRGISDYCDAYGMQPQEFDAFLQDQNVLDLGSGTAQFATEIELRKLQEPKYRGPKNVFSLNVRYGEKDYPAQWYQAGGRKLIARYASDPSHLKQALTTVKENALAEDWNDLSTLVARGFHVDRIVSKTAFPYFSDIAIRDSATGEFSMGPQSKRTFSQLADILEDGGIGLFETNWEPWEWAMLPAAYKAELFNFFASRTNRLDADFYPPKQGDDVTYVLKVTKKKQD